MTAFLGINVWSVLVASVAQMAVGMVWYGPLFGQAWMRMMGFTAKSMKKMSMTPRKAMILGFVSTVIATYALAQFVSLLGVASFAGAVQLTVWSWLALCMTLNVGDYLWAGKPVKFVLLNSGYRLVSLLVGIMILAYWH